MGEPTKVAGVFVLGIGDYPWNNEWLTILVRKTLPNGSTIDSILVKDKNGNIYKIALPIPRTNGFFGGDFYPSIEDIFVNIDELTELEENFKNTGDQGEEKQTKIFKGISNNSFLEAVGLMAKLIDADAVYQMWCQTCLLEVLFDQMNQRVKLPQRAINSIAYVIDRIDKRLKKQIAM